MGFCKAVESMFESEPKAATELENWLDAKGLAEVRQAIIDASGAQKVADLQSLDAEGINQVVREAKLKAVMASKFRKALKEINTEL